MIRKVPVVNPAKVPDALKVNSDKSPPMRQNVPLWWSSSPAKVKLDGIRSVDAEVL